MSAQPTTIELLERTHTFPGPYMFKVIGRNEDEFVARVLAAAQAELVAGTQVPYSVRETAGGRHISVTLEPTVQTVHEVLAIYRRLRVLVGLVMLL
jgi:putative lipoic acid-binding regulatory protein